MSEYPAVEDCPDDWVRHERSFRGISRRLAAHYLRTLGGELVGTDDPEEATEVTAADWCAALAVTTVSPAGSITLTEVRITFVGEPDRLDELIDAFATKAMRAGG